MPPLIELESVQFRWPNAKQATLDLPHLSIAKKQHCLIHGKSGAGKTTLLNLITGISQSQSGSVRILGRDLVSLSATKRDQFRADHMGVVFQQFNLLPYLNVIDNVLLPLSFSRSKRQKASGGQQQAQHYLKTLGLADAHHQRAVTELSVGQQQRVAVARALIGKPEIIIADEPTSALDNTSRDQFLDLLFPLANEQNSTVIMVSHDRAIEGYFPQTIELSNSGVKP